MGIVAKEERLFICEQDGELVRSERHYQSIFIHAAR